MNKLSTKDSLLKRHILMDTNVSYSIGCDSVDDQDHLFFQCNFYGRFWYMISSWLGITFISQGELRDHSHHVWSARGFSKNSCTTFNSFWCSSLFGKIAMT